jgi:hypothetical protein
MDQPKPPAEMTDQGLRREWECLDCEVDTERTDELAAEMSRRQIDF